MIRELLRGIDKVENRTIAFAFMVYLTKKHNFASAPEFNGRLAVLEDEYNKLDNSDYTLEGLSAYEFLISLFDIIIKSYKDAVLDENPGLIEARLAESKRIGEIVNLAIESRAKLIAARPVTLPYNPNEQEGLNSYKNVAQQIVRTRQLFADFALTRLNGKPGTAYVTSYLDVADEATANRANVIEANFDVYVNDLTGELVTDFIALLKNETGLPKAAGVTAKLFKVLALDEGYYARLNRADKALFDQASEIFGEFRNLVSSRISC